MNLQKKWLPLILCLFLILSLAVSLVPRGAPVAGATSVLTDVPAFDWSYGCSATSAAMLFGYYDRIGYSNMYTGPENGGVCPLDNSCWDHTTWPSITCGECPLSATHNGIDGRAIRGHVDDYWIDYQVVGPDPWVGNWMEHTPDCAGDYMGTNQEEYYNYDGSTTFFLRTDGDPLYDYTGQEPTKRDGCHGMRLFAESRGYTVETNFSQKIEGAQGTDPDKGFTFGDFQDEIDAGRPVLIHVTGHTMLGYGYDTSTNTIHIHDTYDYDQHTMTWGGTYDGRQHYAVTVIRLQPLQPYYLSISSTAGGSVTTPGEPGPFPYSPGTVVNLVGTPDAGYSFVNWTGDVSTIADDEDATTTITMNGDYSITANFALEIWDWYDLDAVRNNLGGGYILMNNLDSSTAGYTQLASPTANGGEGWQPIEGFTGTFNGHGYTIRDLCINRPDENTVGLFGYADVVGVIENVGILDAKVTGGYAVGSLVGYLYNGTVSNSYCTGSVTGGDRTGGLVGETTSGTVSDSYSASNVTGDFVVGGLIAYNYNGTVSNSYSTGSVTSGGELVGGLAGENGGITLNCYSTGNVTGYGEVGGLVGLNNGNVTDSYSTGSVTGNSAVGGLIGWNFNTFSVSNSYSTGSVTGSDLVGGLVGLNNGSVSDSYSAGSVTGNTAVGGLVGDSLGVGGNPGTVSYSFWDIQTSGQATSGGGTGKTTAEMQDIATFSGATWNITTISGIGERNPAYIWNIVDNVTYPFLSWQSVS